MLLQIEFFSLYGDRSEILWSSSIRSGRDDNEFIFCIIDT